MLMFGFDFQPSWIRTLTSAIYSFSIVKGWCEMHQHRKTPLRVPIVAAIVAILVSFLFGGVTRASDETSLQSAATQSANEAQSSVAVTATAATNNEDQSSSGVVATATTTDKDAQPANGGHGCISRDISPGEVDTLLQTQDGSVEFTAYEAVRFSITLTLEEGHCSGDSIIISVPSELGTDGDDSPVPMTTPSGVVIGYATYNGTARTVTVTLTEQVEVPGRQDFHASAWWTVHMEPSLVPGETRELRWNVDGVIRRQSIQVGACDGCSVIGNNPSKWGSVDGNTQHVTVVLPTADHDGQEFVVTDTLTSPGQQFVCSDLLVGRVGVYHSAGPWGQPMYDRFQDPTVVSCDSSKATLSVTLNTGEKARLQLNVGVDAADPGPWSDSATITSQDKSWEVSTRVVRRESGGNAGFTPTPTPAPSPSPSAPAPTPSTSPTPEPTPSVTPTPSASPSPSPSAPSPSVTPTPSPSTTPSTPTPSPSATPTPSPSTTPTRRPVPLPTPVIERYKEPTPSAIPTPAPQHKKLAVTGTSGDVVTSAVALVALGGFLIWARRRQTAHSER